MTALEHQTHPMERTSILNEFSRAEILEKISMYVVERQELTEAQNNIVQEAERITTAFPAAEATVISELSKLSVEASQQVQFLHLIADIIDENIQKAQSQEDLSANLSECILQLQNNAQIPPTEVTQRKLGKLESAIATRNIVKIKSAASDLSTHLKNPHEQWKVIVKDPLVPTELIENIDEIAHSVKVRRLLLFIEEKTTHLTDQEKKVVRAHILVPLLNDNYEPDLILDLIQGKYDLQDPTWFGNFAESYFQTANAVKKVERNKRIKWPAKLAILGSLFALAGVLLLNPFAKNKSMISTLEKSRQSESTDDEINRMGAANAEDQGDDGTELSPGTSSSAAGKIDNGESGKPTKTQSKGSSAEGNNAEDAAPGSGAANEGGAQPGENTNSGTDGGPGSEGAGGAAGPGGQASETAEGKGAVPPQQMNGERSLEQHEETLSQQTVWEISGEVPEGYFWMDSSSAFNYDGWIYGYEISYSLYMPSIDEDAPTQVQSAEPVASIGHYAIPVPDGWEITAINAGSAIGSLHVTNTGSYFFSVDARPSEPQIITYALAPLSHPELAVDDLKYENLATRETLDTASLLGNLDRMPTEVKLALDEIRTSNMTTAEKAESVRQMVHDHFVYSLDPKYTAYYVDDAKAGDFVWRAWEIGFADCDPVNTVNVAFLRYIGIDARLSSGYMNESLFSSGSNSLEGGERHAWAEYFDTSIRKWVVSDATPADVDEDAAEQIIGMNGGTGIESVIEESSAEEVNAAIALTLARIVKFETSEVGMLLNFTLIGFLYTLLLGLGIRREHKIDAQAANILNDISTKLWTDAPELEEFRTAAINNANTLFSKLLLNPPNKPYKLWERLLLSPRIRKTEIDMRKLGDMSTLSDRLPQTDQVIPTDVSMSDFLQKALGVSPMLVEQTVKEEIRTKSLKQIYTVLKGSLSHKFEPELQRAGVNLTALPLANLCADYSDTSEFIYAALDALYKKYLLAFDKAIKRRAKRKDDLRKTKTLPTVEIFITDHPLGQVEFVQKFDNEIAILLQYHTVHHVDRQQLSTQAEDQKLNTVASLLDDIDRFN